MYFTDFEYLYPFEDIRCRSLKSTEIEPHFACFWPLFFFWGGEVGPRKFGPAL